MTVTATATATVTATVTAAVTATATVTITVTAMATVTGDVELATRTKAGCTAVAVVPAISATSIFGAVALRDSSIVRRWELVGFAD